MTTNQRRLRIGFVGVGIGAAAILPQADGLPDLFEVAGGADINPRVRQAFQDRYPDASVYDTAEGLIDDNNIDAVWIATPNRFHTPHTLRAAERGKHIICEKPMALDLKDAERMIEAADKAGVNLLCGHTQGFMPQVRAMRRVVKSGRLGPVKVVNSTTFTDWMVSPRPDDEADLSQGGGLIYRQVPHQADTIRLLADSKVVSLRGNIGQWADWRPKTPGFYTALMQFENGVVSQMTYNGYGYFLTQEMVEWGTDASGSGSPADRGAVRQMLRDGKRPEADLKDAGRIGGARPQERGVARSAGVRDWVPGNTGIVLVSCEKGDLRYARRGITIYSDEGKEEMEVNEPYTPGREDLTELYGAVVNGKTVFHSGRWGIATLEISMAILQSAKEGREVKLSHQVKMPDDYDLDS